MRSSDLTLALKRSLGPLCDHAPRIAHLLEATGTGMGSLEASVRSGRDEAASGGRMMIERLSPDLARDVVSPIAPLPPIAEELLRVATRERLSLIAGWDVVSGPVAKLYLNASDASAKLRSRIRRELIAHDGHGPEAPHVIGLNFSSDGVEVKLYEQGERLWGEAPRAFADWAATQSASGFVRSWQLSEKGARPKAWFVGLREQAGPFATSWPDADRASILDAAPFPPGAILSVGVSPEPIRWTFYFKPLGQSSPSWSLDPIACFSDGSCEVGLYLEPASLERRAYARTERWAISFRAREGEPRRETIERLMAWYLEKVKTHADDPAPYLHSPPEPWHAVD